VSAWPEPPDVMSAGPSAGARCGVQGTFAIVGFIRRPFARSKLDEVRGLASFLSRDD